MKTKVLIKMLQECDPSGEEEVCVDNADIHYISEEPAYYDGPLQILVRNEKVQTYNIIGGIFKFKGIKINISPLQLKDAYREARLDWNRKIKPFPIEVQGEWGQERIDERIREWDKEIKEMKKRLLKVKAKMKEKND